MAGSEEFVFKNNPFGELEFVGDFDLLYRSTPDPWGQSGSGVEGIAEYYAYSRLVLLKVLGARIFSDLLEVGCGHGFVVNLLARHNPGVVCAGMDVSIEAIRRATELWHHQFFVGDLTNPDLMPNGPHDNEDHLTERYDVVVLGQVWWYILHDLATALGNCNRLLKPGGLLVVSQAFLSNQRYGVDIANGFMGAIDALTRRPWPYDMHRWRLLEAHYEDTPIGGYYDGLLVLRKA